MYNSKTKNQNVVHELLITNFNKDQLAIITTASLDIVFSGNIKDTVDFLTIKRTQFKDRENYH